MVCIWALVLPTLTLFMEPIRIVTELQVPADSEVAEVAGFRAAELQEAGKRYQSFYWTKQDEVSKH